MKKKILFGAVIAAALFGFASCQKEIGDINWRKGAVGSGDGTTTFLVNQKNEKTDEKIRGMKEVGILKRAQGTCIVQIKDQKSGTQQAGGTRDGVAGFATCFTKNKTPAGATEKLPNDGTYNFLLVGVRWEYNKADYYVSYYCNIKESEMNTNNFGAGTNTKTAYDPTATEPYEIELQTFKTLTNAVLDNGTLTVAIKFEGKTDGTIDVTLLKDVVTNTQAATTSGGTQLDKYVVQANSIGNQDRTQEGKLCVYANIYEQKTLNARWDIYDVSWKAAAVGNADEEEKLDFGDIFFQEF